MSPKFFVARLESREAVAISGPDWRDFLQGLITQDVLTLRPGEIRFGALLTPQGRLLFDLFVVGQGDDCLIDCAAATCDALIERLTMYRLRAKVRIERTTMAVFALWGDGALEGFMTDPRTPGLGWRAYGGVPPAHAEAASEAEYDSHRLSLGIPGSGDWGTDATYPIEANFDLLAGIDFKKGCFVGQETTSRMKRRSAIRSRLVPIDFDGLPPDPGAELLAGSLRAGEVRSVHGNRAMALVRLDRLQAGTLTYASGRPWQPVWPTWLAPDGG